MSAARVIYQIDLGQLKRNFMYVQQCAKGCRVMPVLKYDAYGMGAMAVGKALKEAGACRFAVADVNEAHQVKSLGLDVQILGLLPPEETEEAVALDLICPVYDLSQAEGISREALKQKKSVRIAVKLDTGMGRLGFIPEESAETIARIVRLPGLIPDGLYAHFSTAAKPDLEYAAMQIGRFKALHAALAAQGITFPNVHHAAGDASVKIPDAVKEPFNLVRPGGILYGEEYGSPLPQIVSLKTKVGAVRKIAAGRSVGYFRLFTAPKDTPVALISAGYADGIPLALSNRGSVLIHGARCPILGRISMDYTVADISALDHVVMPGDEAVLLGKQGDEAVTVQEWGKLKSTHAHDIWCSIGHRVQRVYCES